MSLPIIEQIAVAVTAVVDAVTAAAGYHQDLTAVRPKRSDWSDVAPVDNTVLVWQADDDPVETAAYGTLEFVQDFVLVCFVLDSDTAVDSLDTRLNAVKSDLRTAFAAASTLGGLALDVLAGPSVKFDDGKGLSGTAVTFAVHYRTLLTDPNTQV
jgi:hypothetical protein